jgi:hypothetical protein
VQLLRSDKLCPKVFVPVPSYALFAWIATGATALFDFFDCPAGSGATVTIRGKNKFIVSPFADPYARPVRLDVASLVGHTSLPSSSRSSWFPRLCTRVTQLRNTPSKHASGEASEEQHTPICSICHDKLQHDLWAVHCGHVFHGECLGAACSQQLACPTCRATITTEEDVKKLFFG